MASHFSAFRSRRAARGLSLLETTITLVIMGLLALVASAVYSAYIESTYTAAALNVMDQTANDLAQVAASAGSDGISVGDISTVVQTLPDAFAYGSSDGEVVAETVAFVVVSACPTDETGVLDATRLDNLLEADPTYHCGRSTGYGEISTSLQQDETATDVGLAMLSKNGECIIGLVSVTDGVTVENAGVLGDCSGSAALTTDPTVRPAGPPAAPDPLTGDAGDELVDLHWPRSPESDVIAYWVYRDGALVATVAQPASATTVSATVTGLTNGTSYTFIVRAIDDTSQRSDPSNALTLTPQAPGTGIDLAASAGERSASLTWSTPDARYNVTEFRVYRDNSPWVVLPLATTSYLDADQDAVGANPAAPAGLVPYQAYQYLVVGLDNTGAEVTRSNTVTVTPLDSTAPPIPELVSTLGGVDKIDVSYRHVVTPYGDLAGYRVYWCVGEMVDCPVSAFSSQNSVEISALDGSAVAGAVQVWSHIAGLQTSTFYTYQVTAFDTFGNESSPSARLSARSIVPSLCTTATYTWTGDTKLLYGVNQPTKAYHATGITVPVPSAGDTQRVLSATYQAYDTYAPGTSPTRADKDQANERFGIKVGGVQVGGLSADLPDTVAEGAVDVNTSGLQSGSLGGGGTEIVGGEIVLYHSSNYGYTESMNSLQVTNVALEVETCVPSSAGVLSATPLERSVRLDWTLPSGFTPTSYAVQRGGVTIATVNDGATLRYTDSGVVPGVIYTYKVIASDATHNTVTNEATAQPFDHTAPPVPVFTVTGGVGKMTLNWSGVLDTYGDLAGYQLYWCQGRATTTCAPVAAYSAQKMFSVGPLAATYTHMPLPESTWYSYRMRSFDTFGNVSDFSAPREDVTAAQAPSPPLQLAVQNGERQVRLSWLASLDPTVRSYRIYRDGVLLSSLTYATLTYTDTGLVPNRDYVYYVTSFDTDALESLPSNSVTGRPYDHTAPAVPVPSAVGGVKQITVSWPAISDPYSDLSGYQVYFCDGTAVTCTDAVFAGYVSAGTNMAQLDKLTRSLTQTGLGNGITRTYRVRSYDAYGNYSALSTSASATTEEVPVSPVPAVTTSSASQLTWNWTAVTGATYYRVRVGAAVTDLGTTRSYQRTGLSQGTFYGDTAPAGIEVSACNTAGCSDWAWGTGWTNPGAPTIAASAGLVKRVDVTVTNPAGTETRFYVFRSNTNLFSDATIIGNFVPVSQTWATYTYQDATAAAGRTYYYWVQAQNDGGMGVQSNRAAAATAPDLLPAPTSVTISEAGRHWNVVKWPVVANSIRYRIDTQRQVLYNGVWVDIASEIINANVALTNCDTSYCTLRVFNNWAGERVRYQIFAVDSSDTVGNGRWSSYVSYGKGFYAERSVCGYPEVNQYSTQPVAVSNNAAWGTPLIKGDTQKSCSYFATRVRDMRSPTALLVEDERQVMEISAIIKPSMIGNSTIFGVDSWSIENNFFIGMSSTGQGKICAQLHGDVTPIGSGMVCAYTAAAMSANSTYFLKGIWAPGIGLAVEWYNVNSPKTFSVGSVVDKSTVAWVKDGPNGSGGTSGIWTGSAWSPPNTFTGKRFFSGEIMDTQWFRL